MSDKRRGGTSSLLDEITRKGEDSPAEQETKPMPATETQKPTKHKKTLSIETEGVRNLRKVQDIFFDSTELHITESEIVEVAVAELLKNDQLVAILMNKRAMR